MPSRSVRVKEQDHVREIVIILEYISQIGHTFMTLVLGNFRTGVEFVAVYSVNALLLSCFSSCFWFMARNLSRHRHKTT